MCWVVLKLAFWNNPGGGFDPKLVQQYVISSYFFTTVLCSAIFTKVAFSMRTFFFLFGMESSAAWVGLELYVAGLTLNSSSCLSTSCVHHHTWFWARYLNHNFGYAKQELYQLSHRPLLFVGVYVGAHAYIHTQMCTCYSMYVEVRGGHVEVSSLLSLCRSQGPESVHQLGSKPFSIALVADSLR